MDSILSGETTAAPMYQYWQSRYQLTAVDSLERLADDDPDVLMLAQPRALNPADLADLDDWVRAGGAAIILTDPQLDWPSSLPLGDPRRPLAIGLLSPLLDHWGLQLVGASPQSAGAEEIHDGEHHVPTSGVGAFELSAAKADSQIDCELRAANVIADCAVAEGRAVIVADADFLDEGYWMTRSGLAPQGSAAGRFVDSLVADQIQGGSGRK